MAELSTAPHAPTTVIMSVRIIGRPFLVVAQGLQHEGFGTSAHVVGRVSKAASTRNTSRVRARVVGGSTTKHAEKVMAAPGRPR